MYIHQSASTAPRTQLRR